MVTTPVSRTFFRVPERTAGVFSSLAGGGAVRSAPPRSSAPARTVEAPTMPATTAMASTMVLFTTASRAPRAGERSDRGQSRDGRPRRNRRRRLLLGRAELLLELGDRRRRERIADHVGGAAAHVEELVDSEDQQEPGLRNAELFKRRQDHD